MTNDAEPTTSVLYNAACPVCSYEINHYASYSEARALPISFDDLNNAATCRQWGIDADTAARRLHVSKNGEILAGIPAFIALWQDMPRYHWLARIVSLPGIRHLACWGYDYVLAPAIYRWHLRRLKRTTMRS